jgi:hypothetical protein
VGHHFLRHADEGTASDPPPGGTVHWLYCAGNQGRFDGSAELRNLETQPNPPDSLFVEAGNAERPGGVLSYVPYGTRIPVLETVSARSGNSVRRDCGHEPVRRAVELP